MTAGYSGTPLAKKLGIRDGFDFAAIDAPPDYAEWLGTLPPDARCIGDDTRGAALVHVFVTSQAVLRDTLMRLRKSLAPDVPVWVSWPKRASKVPTDVTGDTIRAAALPLGFVDIKVCAVSEVWSGLKLVVRKELRGG